MSKSKFASLTAGLLARKGEAAPSAHAAFALNAAFPPDEAAAPPAHKTGPLRDLSELIERRVRPVPPAGLTKPDASSPPIQSPPIQPPSVQPPATPGRSVVISAAAVEPPALAPVFGLRGRLPPPQAPQTRVMVLPAGLDGRLHRTAVTVRLDDERYLRLKLTGARFHRTNQEILTRALDAYLTALGVEAVDDAALARWRAGDGGV